jgi:hypothetical protein
MIEPERPEVIDSALVQYRERYGSMLGSLLHGMDVTEKLIGFGRGGIETRIRQLEQDKRALHDKLIGIWFNPDAFNPEDRQGAVTLMVEHITNTPRNIDLGMR